jgi:hypothetical protein
VPVLPLSRLLRSACLTAGTLAATGCALTFEARTLGANVTVAAAPGGAPCAAEFRRSEKAVFLLWGLVAASQPSLQRALGGQVTGAQSVANLRIEVRSRLVDVLVTGLTAGLVTPRTVTFEGCVLNP